MAQHHHSNPALNSHLIYQTQKRQRMLSQPMLALCIALLVSLSACLSASEQVVVIAPDCGDFVLTSGMICQKLEVGEGVRLRAENQQTFTIYNLSLTLEGILYAIPERDTLGLYLTDGLMAVSANSTTRLLNTGDSLIVPLTYQQVVGSLPAITPFDPNTFAVLPSANPTPELIGTLVDPAVLLNSGSPTASGDCTPPSDWVGSYTVKRGDTLTRIASRFGITLDELVQANCLTDPDRLVVDDRLIVPQAVPTETSGGTATPSAVAFRADKDTLKEGECTVLRWDVFNVSAVLIDEQVSTLNNLLQVCPTNTSTTYTLRVIYFDGTESTHTVTVQVIP